MNIATWFRDHRTLDRTKGKAPRPIVITIPGTITQGQFDRVTQMIKTHKEMLRKISRIDEAFEPARERYGMARDNFAGMIIEMGMKDPVIKILKDALVAKVVVQVADICAIIPDYSLAAAGSITEAEEALDAVLEALRDLDHPVGK